MIATGQSMLRREDPDLLTGRAIFVADLEIEQLADSCHAVFVRSTFAHARIESVSVIDAGVMPGVVRVVTSDEISHLVTRPFAPSFHEDFAQPLLAGHRVRYVGEPIAVVLAETVAQAVDAAELVEVSYAPLEAVVGPDRAVADGVLLFDGAGTNIVARGSAAKAEPEIFDRAAVVVHRRVVNPRQSAAPIEPRGVACFWSGDDVHLWSSTQRPHNLRDRVSKLYGIDRQRVHVVAGPNVGGGFGGKGTASVEEQLIPELSRLVERPVRWIETRTEHQTASTQGRGEILDVTLVGTREGVFEGVRMHLLKDCGAYPVGGALIPPNYSGPMVSGPYVIPHAEFAYTSVVTNAPSIGAFRGAGRAPVIDALECAVDGFAATIGMDPADLRRRNLVTAEQMPYTSATGVVYDEADYPRDLERALELADYSRLRVEQERRRAATDVRQLGIGVVPYNHMTNGAGGEDAHVTIRPDGSALVITGSTSQGHGHDITWAQIASDVLAIPVEAIEVVQGNTDAIATGIGAVGSRSLQTAGVAVHRASEVLVDRARQLAADHFEADAGDVVLDTDRGVFHVVGTPAVGMGWSELAIVGQHTDNELACGENFAGPNTFPSGCHIAIVEVDTETGGAQVVRFVAIDDAGPRVNPMIVDGQLHGGIAAGIGQALGEIVDFDDDGNPITANFMDYAIATIDLMPLFELEPSTTSSSFNQLGFKGVGESGTIGAAAAVHLAVVDAIRPLGVSHLDMPCTPLRIWEAINRSEHDDS